MRKEGTRLIIETAPPKSLRAVLAGRCTKSSPQSPTCLRTRSICNAVRSRYRRRFRKRTEGGPPLFFPYIINEVCASSFHVLCERVGKALDCTVVTDNEKEFARVKGLRLGNWLR
jgi:hypothetical protein